MTWFDFMGKGVRTNGNSSEKTGSKTGSKKTGRQKISLKGSQN
jgi:hypothetical protein